MVPFTASCTLNSIMFQSAAGCTIQFNFGLFVGGHRGDQIQFGEGEVALRGHGLEGRSRPERLLLLHDLEGPLRQVPCLAGGPDPRSGLLQSILRIPDFNPDLLFQLLPAQFGLPVFQLGAVLVGLGHAIAQRDIQIQPDVVVRRGIVEGILPALPRNPSARWKYSASEGCRSDSAAPPVPIRHRSRPAPATATVHCARLSR